MGFWNEGGFFQSMAGHLIKWWQIVIMPVFRLDNNRNASDALEMPTVSNQPAAVKPSRNAEESVQMETAPQTQSVKNVTEETVIAESVHFAETSDDTAAADILNRLQEEKQAEEEKKRQAIEEMRKKAEEEERIAAIMNANKVAVDEFIAEGKANRESIEEEELKNAEEERKQEELRRAQEIIDRLNREAAEDEAKKAAEIAKAKEEAKEKFG